MVRSAFLRVPVRAAGMVACLAGGVMLCPAQEGEFPPVIVGLKLCLTPCQFDAAQPGGFDASQPEWDPDVDGPLREGDTLYVCLRVLDLDFTSEEVQDDPNSTEQTIQLTMQSTWWPYRRGTVTYGPQPPGVPSDKIGEFGDVEFETPGFNFGFYTGYPPTDGSDTTSVQLEFIVPEFTGANQARLKGYINYDVRWSVRVTVRNPGQNVEDLEPDSVVFWVYAIENPTLAPGNPPPSADAGPDQTVGLGPDGTVTVCLDGSLSLDRSNVGFSPFDPEVFDKDMLRYTWEWVSGPERVDPEPDPQAPSNLAFGQWPIAYVTLSLTTTPDNPYVYRLLVEDGVNSPPSVDSMRIWVESTPPVNEPPRAVITCDGQDVSGKTVTKRVGERITLSAATSSDPDDDSLIYRWRQTDELGADLPSDLLLKSFQPLEGTDSEQVSWVATAAGTYYFSLLVTDVPRPGLNAKSSRARVTVVVEEAAGGSSAAARQNADANDSTVKGEQSTEGDAGPTGPSACGGSSLLPLAAVPLLVRFTRCRRR